MIWSDELATLTFVLSKTIKTTLKAKNAAVDSKEYVNVVVQELISIRFFSFERCSSYRDRLRCAYNLIFSILEVTEVWLELIGVVELFMVEVQITVLIVGMCSVVQSLDSKTRDRMVRTGNKESDLCSRQ